MIVHAPAKINLGLRILRKRPDGFHDLETVFHRIGLRDTLHLEQADSGITMTCSEPTLPTDERNLCVRAAAAVLKHLGVRAGIRMHLEKRIPHGAGLGGGSSDAASVLKAVPELLSTKTEPDALHAIAVSLGSDVPYFLGEGDAHATGRGEILTHFNADFPFHLVVVVPPVHVSTAWAYSQIRPSDNRDASLRRMAGQRAWLRADMTEAVLANDFEQVVFAAHPQLQDIKNALHSCGALFAQMSGSGSALFGIFDDQVTDVIVQRLTSLHGCRVVYRD